MRPSGCVVVSSNGGLFQAAVFSLYGQGNFEFKPVREDVFGRQRTVLTRNGALGNCKAKTEPSTRMFAVAAHERVEHASELFF